jgi:hypothetical protein
VLVRVASEGDDNTDKQQHCTAFFTLLAGTSPSKSNRLFWMPREVNRSATLYVVAPEPAVDTCHPGGSHDPVEANAMSFVTDT